MPADQCTVLCVASYYKGDRFLVRCKQEGCRVLLLTSEKFLNEPWPRQAIDEVFALPHFQDRRLIVNAVSYLARSRPIRRIVALDDFDVEIAALLREHLRVRGMGESAARLFRDKLAMRTKARELGVRIPEFVGIVNHGDVRHFLATVPGPWLLKPRSEASSMGIQRLNTAEEVWRAIEKLGDDQSFHLIERLVPGDLYHVDSLVADGRVVFAEVNKYYRPLLDVYHGGGVYATRTVPRDRPEVAALRGINARVLAGFGLERGASHTEFMQAHADGEFYFIETSARVGGANTAEMVEAATGVNLWSEWAWLETHPDEGYEPPPVKNRYAGVVISLAKQEHPDTSPFTDPEIVERLDKKHHVGFVVAADSPERVEKLLTDYSERIRRDYTTTLPPATSATA
ncbi:MAG TPA: ATP-grasp domain-containing protein [Gemmataceae bacterium]|nr:ATP-grasp domain-containing protein [Gemmataceae bacterium]